MRLGSLGSNSIQIILTDSNLNEAICRMKGNHPDTRQVATLGAFLSLEHSLPYVKRPWQLERCQSHVSLMVLLPHCLLETEVVEVITSLGILTNLHNQYSWELFILVVSVRLLLHDYPRAGLVTYEEINRQFDMLTYITGTVWYVAAVNFWLRLTVSVNRCTLSRFDSLVSILQYFDVIQFM